MITAGHFFFIFCESVPYTVFHLLSHQGIDTDTGAWYGDRDGKMAIQSG